MVSFEITTSSVCVKVFVKNCKSTIKLFCTRILNKLSNPSELNNLKVKLYLSWNFGECRIPNHCNRSNVHSGGIATDRSIRTFGHLNSVLILK